MKFHAGDYDVIVVGGGHAGCEAAFSAARLNKRVCMFTLSVDMIASLPCNPSIGGSSKGHLVREIDALGGEMGKVIDKTYIQSKMLNVGKGPAVHSLRAQTDKKLYAEEMLYRLNSHPNIQIKQAEIGEILVENGKVTGVMCIAGAVYTGEAVILCTGTYLNARCLYGEVITETGPNGSPNSTRLTDCLKKLNIPMLRFKTGTPARIDKRTIDFSKMEPQYGDEKVTPFSFTSNAKDMEREQILCHLTYTNEETHKIIKDNLHRSPMHMGIIEGTGTRYCPSIEDKIVRFADKGRHQTFIEPEGLRTNEMYIQGISSALPLDVQQAFYRTIAGLEHCEIVRPAYAIEYDLIDATCLNVSLMFKDISGLFSAGQFNGSSGYEEAAAQGIVAGINASRYIDKLEPFILTRGDSYIGVLIDDLVTKGTKEPYRMMTARSEYRLLLRQDNADIRLTQKGHAIGLIDDERFEKFKEKERQISTERERITKVILSPTEEVNTLLKKHNSCEITTGIKLSDLVKRPELNYFVLESLDKDRPSLPTDVQNQVDIETKYEGYIARQDKQVMQLAKMENRLLPNDINYESITGLRLEARGKLSKIRPRSLGQASRITGVSPADISVLIIYLEAMK